MSEIFGWDERAEQATVFVLPARLRADASPGRAPDVELRAGDLLCIPGPKRPGP